MDFKQFKEAYEQVPVKEYENKAKNKVLVSVCVQTYQHAKFIGQCLDGILMQKTNFDFEILLGEDTSTDGTREICIEYAEKYSDRIRLFLHHRGNNMAIGGSPTGRFILMTNIFSAKGKYIALCEGDDYWTDPYKLQKQVDFLEKNEDFVLSFHDTSVVGEFGNFLSGGRLKNDKPVRTRKELVVGAHIPTPTILFRNNINLLPRQIVEVKNGDTLLFAFLGHFGKGYRHFDIDNAKYRVHSGGIWSGKEPYQRFKHSLETFENILGFADNEFYKPLYRKLMSINYNLIRKAPDTTSRLVHLKKMVHYSLMYFITK